MYKELQILQNTIKKKEEQLKIINAISEEHQQAITTLTSLRNAGITDNEIAQLIELVKMWNGIGAGTGGLNIFAQGNGGKMGKLDDKLLSTATGNNGNGNNGYGGPTNLSISDLRKFNLLK